MSVDGRALATVLALLVLVSALPLALPLGAAAAAGPPAGMSQIPDENVVDARASTLEGDGLDAPSLSVYASDHASTLNASIVTESQADSVARGTPLPDVANQRVCSTPAAECNTTPSLVLTDDEISEGREVALRAAPLEAALGYTPEKITVRNSETGDKWTYRTETVDGWIIIDVEHFSSNSVTWTSTVSLSGTYTDGSTSSYSLSDVNAVDTFSASFTGNTATETETVSKTGVADGGSLSHSVAGNLDATNAEVTFTGNNGATSADHSWTGLSSGATKSITNGNLRPTGPASNSNPEVTVTPTDTPSGTYTEYDGGDTSEDRIYYQSSQGSSILVESAPGTISAIKIKVRYDDTTSNDRIDIYAETGSTSADTSLTDGTRVKSNWAPNGIGTGWKTVQLDDPIDVGGGDVEFSFNPTAGTGQIDIWDDSNDDDASANKWWTEISGQKGAYPAFEVVYEEKVNVDVSGDSGAAESWTGLSQGQTVSGPLDLSSTSSSVSLTTGANSVDVSLTKTNQYATENPALDVDGDGVDDASVSGLLNDSETATKSLSNLPTGSYTSDVSLAAHNVDVSLSYTERTETVDPTLDVNGNTVGHTGTLSDGTTTSLTMDPAWVQNGTNDVTVTTGSLSADAPAPKADLSYSHDAHTNQSVVYDVEQWSVHQNVSKTFASSRSSANLSMPLQSDVVAVRSLEYRVDGGTWTSVPSSSYTFVDGGPSVEVDVDSLTTISDGTTIEVRETGSRVDVKNGAITVLNATEPADSLDTKIQLDSWGSDSRIDVGPTAEGDRVHYLYGESWSAPSEYVIVDAGGAQSLYAPSASPGSTARVRHMETQVSVETGDVKLEVLETGSSPEIDVSPGPAGSGDPVSVKYYRTTSGTEYILNSLTRSIVLDSDVAQSPAVFEDDDSGETWTILSNEGNSSSDVSVGGGGGGAIQVVQEPRGVGLPVVLIGALVALILAYLILRRIRAPSSTSNPSAASRATGAIGGAVRSVFTSRRGLAAIAGVVLLGLVVTGAITIPRTGQIILLVAGIPLVAFVGLRSIDQYSPVAFGVVAAISLILGLTALGSGILDRIVEQLGPAIPLIAIAGVYLAYKAIQAARAPEETNRVTLNVRDDGGD